MLKGKIIKNISDTYTVICDNTLYECKARGKLRNDKISPIVGDNVEFDEENNYILNILERENELIRPSICNVDVALIVTSIKKPDLSFNLLDKQLVTIYLSNIEPVICFTKLDLASKKELKDLKALIKYYESLGIKVFNNQKLKPMIKYIKNKTIVLTGQSGAGKSSLLNKLDRNLNLQVGEISTALNRGKHTTRHTEIYQVKGMNISDTPGFSALDLSSYEKEDIRDSFKEFKKFKCPYKDCMHINEENCAVKEALKNGKILPSRYINYGSFVREVKK